MKGFTLVEVGVLIAIVILAVLIGFMVLTEVPETPQTEQEHCSWYANSSVQNLPAKCMKYYK